MSDARLPLYLMGCGSAFDAIAGAWDVIAPGRMLVCVRLESTDAIAHGVAEVLRPLDPSGIRIFVAVDQNALNFARLDLYRQARLLGFKGDTLVHPRAVVEPGATLGENCWIAAAALLSSGVRVGNNSFVGAAARLDAQASIAAHVWVGAGASIGLHASVGSHSVVGADVHVAAHVRIGRYCAIDVPGAYRSTCADGTFMDPLFPLPVRMYGAPIRRAAADAGVAP